MPPKLTPLARPTLAEAAPQPPTMPRRAFP